MVLTPGLIKPEASASSIMRLAIRSLTEPPALKNSHLATRIYKKSILICSQLPSLCTLTKFTLETLFLANLVYPHQGCLTNVIQDSVEDLWARDAIKEVSVIRHTYQLYPCNTPLDVIVLIGRDVDVLSGHGRKSKEEREAKPTTGLWENFGWF